jgi:hypothetical protein
MTKLIVAFRNFANAPKNGLTAGQLTKNVLLSTFWSVIVGCVETALPNATFIFLSLVWLKHFRMSPHVLTYLTSYF